jgi:hypothetical protein
MCVGQMCVDQICVGQMSVGQMSVGQMIFDEKTQGLHFGFVINVTLLNETFNFFQLEGGMLHHY